jgi:hypothetical protein
MSGAIRPQRRLLRFPAVRFRAKIILGFVVVLAISGGLSCKRRCGRHCERSEAIQGREEILNCRKGDLANTVAVEE